MFIDTHAHLDFPEFKGDVPAVLGRAKEAGVGRILNVGIDVESSKHSLELARRYPEIYSTVGVHPHCAKDLTIETSSSLLHFATSSDKVVAVGEIGLDYYFLKRSSKYAEYPTREEQIICFEQMLDLAMELKMPIIVHNREADADILAILKTYSTEIRGVVHCFSSDWEYAEKMLDLGFMLSFTGNITYKNDNIVEVIRKTPLGSIMIETDSPYLTPEPYRGKRNEPAHVIEVAKKIAEIKNIPLTEVEAESTKRAMKFFGIK
ncbi:MAG: TatD family hydrolase [Candidatus Berkelbacteria bacterium]